MVTVMIIIGLIALVAIDIWGLPGFSWFYVYPGALMVRVGLGGKRIIREGRFFAHKHFHIVTKVPLGPIPLDSNIAFITRDGFRSSADVRFVVRVRDSDDGITMAARGLTELREGNQNIIDGYVILNRIEVMLFSEFRLSACKRTRDQLSTREGFVGDLKFALSRELYGVGLFVESISVGFYDFTKG
jgi:uncharacterized membrane protein YqiK